MMAYIFIYWGLNDTASILESDFLNETYHTLIPFSLKFVSKGPIDDKSVMI